MRALYFEKELKYVTGYPTPQPGSNEALIRITHAGICNTDIEITRGYMGFRGIPGHEFVGIVQECGEKDLIGRRVAGEINIACGNCSYCRNRLQNHCTRRSVLGILNRDGVFAEYTALPLKNLHRIPDSVSDEEAVFVEPLAAAYEILEQVNVSSSDKVCVLGDGKLGLLVAQVIRTTGCSLIAVGNHPEKLSILHERGIKTELGADFNEAGFDLVIDCTGSPSGMKRAFQIIRPKGKIVLKTTVAERNGIDLNQVVINEITLIGSRCGPFPDAIKAIESREIDVNPVISRVFPLDEGIEAFQYASKNGSLKVILKIGP